jgi:hypothetical protein
MALVKYGGGIIQMSGSLAGNTHARNRYGNYMRARTKPINPKSARQTMVRSCIQFLTEYWSETLSALQRTSWNDYADAVAMKNKLGETVKLSGFNHFIRSNTLGQMAGIPMYEDGPTTFTLPDADPTLAITISEATQEISVAFNDAADWNIEVGGHLFIEQGKPQNPQINFFNGPWRYVGQVPGDVVPLTSPQTKACVFAVAESQRVWCYARIQRADARLSTPFQANCFVGA